MAITALAKQMKAAGQDVISLSAGEPDFDTPEHIKEAATRSLSDGFTKYTPPAGTESLKRAIVGKTREDLGLDYSPEQVVVSCGAKHSIYNVVMAACEAGDEVIVPSPYWLSYPDIVKLAGAKPVFVQLPEEAGFDLDVELLKSAIGPATKAIILNSPSNPTGAMYTRETLEQVAELAVEHDLLVISDEIYDKIVFGDIPHCSIATVRPEMQERTVIVNGASKTYAMTGWRIGWALGPEKLMKCVAAMQSHTTSNPTSFAQAGAEAALTGPQHEVQEMVAQFRARRDAGLQALRAIPDVSVVTPAGAFYLFPNMSAPLQKGTGDGPIGTSTALAKYLLERAQVATVPGEPFGSDVHIRLSYAATVDQVKRGVERIGEALSQLR